MSDSATYPWHCFYCKSQVNGICIKHCHQIAGPVWLFNNRSICSFSLRRDTSEFFLNGVSNKGNHCHRYIIPTEILLNDVFLFYIGALSTLVASYLACARGSNEPEPSIARTKDLNQFILECRIFQMDHEHMTRNDLITAQMIYDTKTSVKTWCQWVFFWSFCFPLFSLAVPWSLPSCLLNNLLSLQCFGRRLC